jgi:hypothetical protein
MDELEIADYEILLRVYARWSPSLIGPPNETPEQYGERIRRTMEDRELKQQFRAVLRKLRKAIVGE